MNYKTFTTLLLTLFVASGMTVAQNFVYSPEKPQAGQEMTITFDSEGTPLEGADEIELLAYYLQDGELPEVESVEMTPKNGAWHASMLTEAETHAIVFKMKSGEEEADNDGKGYAVKMYSGDKPVQGACADLAKLYSETSRAMGLDNDLELAQKYMHKEFKLYPESRGNPEVFKTHARLIKRMEDEEGMKEVSTYLEEDKMARAKTEDDWMLIYDLARLMEYENMDAITSEIEKTYPEGKLVMNNIFQDFRQASDPAEKEALYEDYMSLAADDDSRADQMSNMLANAWLDADNWDKFEHYMSKVESPLIKASTYNNLAWGWSGENIDAEVEEDKLEKAKKLSHKSLELVEEAKMNMEHKPSYVTRSDWKDAMKNRYGTYADTYALLLYKLGEKEKAVKYQKKAVMSNDYSSADMNERFAVFADDAAESEETVMILENMIKNNAATDKVKEIFVDMFEDTYTDDEAATKYLALLEEIGRDKLRNQLMEEMISMEAPDFSLKNLAGEEVALADLKGKTLVVDFWATWCGPCIASFPGMQQAVDKYGDNEDVVFLFVNTWERVEDKFENASSFIESNDYSFEVLMDTESKVVKDFGVSGIPTKFVIGPNGMIKFKSVGYSGSAEKLVSELSMMIEMASGKKASSKSVSMN